jgi:hypothetical protein
MARRSSYTNEDSLFSMAIGNNSSQSSLPAYRRLSQYVFDDLHLSLSLCSFSFLPSWHSPMR